MIMQIISGTLALFFTWTWNIFTLPLRFFMCTDRMVTVICLLNYGLFVLNNYRCASGRTRIRNLLLRFMLMIAIAFIQYKLIAVFNANYLNAHGVTLFTQMFQDANNFLMNQYQGPHIAAAPMAMLALFFYPIACNFLLPLFTIITAIFCMNDLTAVPDEGDVKKESLMQPGFWKIILLLFITIFISAFITTLIDIL